MLTAGAAVTAHIRVVEDVPAWKEQLAEVKLRVRLTGNTELDKLTFSLNGAQPMQRD
jgi:hypothetical protein